MYCSFCGKPREDAIKLIAGPSVYICDECVTLCNDIIHEDISEEEAVLASAPVPFETKAFLDEHVIGQEHAKKVLSVAVYNHYKKILNPTKDDDVELDKSNVILLGPTGVGKTLLVSTIAKYLNVPVALCDATTMTESGYVGEDVEHIFARLLQNADYDEERAQMGIVYIDEIDKKSKKGENLNVTRDVSGEGVQQALLKLVEGTIARIPPKGGRKHPNQEMIELDTKNILFIVGGAFIGIEDIVEQRLTGSGIGFNAEVTSKDDKRDKLLSDVEHKDLVKFGLIPEFVGRFPVLTHLDDLNVDDLCKIMIEPKNSLEKQFKKLFSITGLELQITSDAVKEMSEIAIKKDLGARGLRSILEDLLLNIQYNLEQYKKDNVARIIINGNFVREKKEPVLMYEEVPNTQ